MKLKIFFSAALVLLFVASCTNNEVIQNYNLSGKREGVKTVTVTATTVGVDTRVALTPEEGSQKVVITWKEGDKIYIYARKDNTLIRLDPSTVYNIRENGKRADFDVVFPNEFTGTYTLYASLRELEVRGGKLQGTTDKALLRPISELNDPLRYATIENVDADAPQQQIPLVTFQEKGFLLLFSLVNKSGAEWKGRLALDPNTSTNWLADNLVVAENIASPDSPLPPLAQDTYYTVPAGESATFAGWFLSSGEGVTDKLKVAFTSAAGINSTTSAKGRSVNTPFLAGKVYRLPQLVWSNPGFDWWRPKLAIEFMAEHDMASENTFASSHNNDQSILFNWEEANNKFSSIVIDGTSYHLPSKEEWLGIISYSSDDIKFNEVSQSNNVPEFVVIGGDGGKNYTADYKNMNNGTTYALRFKAAPSAETPHAADNSMLCAYRYKRVGTFAPNSLDSGVEITVRYLGTDFVGNIDNISSDAFWDNNDENNIVRRLSASGSVWGNNAYNLGVSGFYWSTTQGSTPDRARVTTLNENTVYSHDENLKQFKFSVRLFRNN